MKFDKHALLLYAVTDRAWTGVQSLYQQVSSALNGGVTCVQLREKELDDTAFLAEAQKISTLCHTHQVPFLVNDNVEIAIQCHADGVHVGQQDGAAAEIRKQIGDQMILGISAQTVKQAVMAEENGADYLGVGAVFSTTTKRDAEAVSYETLQAICHAVSIPVVAIGGIDRHNLLTLSGSGVNGVALISAIFSASDIESECQVLHTLSQQMVQS